MSEQVGGRRPRRIANVGIFAVILGVLGSVAIPAAQAATYTYANGVMTAEKAPRYSGVRATGTGGTAKTKLGVGTVSTVGYWDYPGYTTLGFGVNDNPFVADMYFPRESGVSNKCYWNYHGVGGSTALTCTARS